MILTTFSDLANVEYKLTEEKKRIYIIDMAKLWWKLKPPREYLNQEEVLPLVL